jgi:hypothetical protein
MTEPQNTMAVPEAAQPRNMAAFHLESAGLDVPGVASPHQYINIVQQQLPALGEIENMYAKYEMGLSQIRGDADLTDDQRLDAADQLHEAASTRYQELVAQLETERSEKRSSIERSLFGAPGVGAQYVDAHLVAARAHFTQASQHLLGASEEQLANSVELAGITGDTVLLRASRAVAHQQGFEDVVRASVGQSARDGELYAQRQAVPSQQNLGIIADQYSPPSATLEGLRPDLETKRRAEEQNTAKETRRQRQRLGR